MIETTIKLWNIILPDKIKNKKYHIVGTYLKLNIKIVEKVKDGNPDTHDRSISWRITGTLIKSGEVKLVLCAQTEIDIILMQVLLECF